MKKILLCLLLGTLSINILAQSDYLDVVYLKNGNTVRGKIIEQEAGKFVKIQLDEKNVLLFNNDEIIEIAKKVSQTKTYLNPQYKQTRRTSPEGIKE